MSSLRQWALGCCILCTLTGVIRTFWPDHAFKPVINLVLTLYILTSVIHGIGNANWQGFVSELRSWSEQGLAAEDFSDYGESLEQEQSAAAIQDLLRQSGIESTVCKKEDEYHIRLAYPADRKQAEELLVYWGKEVPWVLEEGQ